MKTYLNATAELELIVVNTWYILIILVHLSPLSVLRLYKQPYPSTYTSAAVRLSANVNRTSTAGYLLPLSEKLNIALSQDSFILQNIHLQ